MPNTRAKSRKQKKRRQNEWLKKHGRTRAQYRKIKKKEAEKRKN